MSWILFFIGGVYHLHVHTQLVCVYHSLPDNCPKHKSVLASHMSTGRVNTKLSCSVPHRKVILSSEVLNVWKTMGNCSLLPLTVPIIELGRSKKQCPFLRGSLLEVLL